MVSLAKAAQSLVRRAGLNVHPWPSARHLALEYPVSASPRYGAKTGPHAAILEQLEARTSDFGETLAALAAHHKVFEAIPASSTENPLRPYWDNGWFPPLDACVLTHFLLTNDPRRFLEIGSGNSTIFANHARKIGGLRTTITSIDPEPRAGIDSLCQRVIRTGLQDTDLSVFDDLESGDILFFDGSHVVFQDLDVTVFFLEICRA